MGLIRRAALAATLASGATAAGATAFPIVETGVVTHMIHGTGIEIQVIPQPMPEEGLAALHDALPGLCRHYAGAVVPHVVNTTGETDATFISIRVLPEPGAETSQARAFRLNGAECGEPF